MIDLVAAFVGITVAAIALVVLKVRADRHDRARTWIEDAEALGLTHRFSKMADIGSEAAGARSGRQVIVRGPRDPKESPYVRVIVAFDTAIPLGMELFAPPGHRPVSVYSSQNKLLGREGTLGWALHAVESDPANELVKAIAEDLDDARRANDAVRIHDGGVMLERDGELSRGTITEAIHAAEALARTIEQAWATIDAPRPAEPVSWPDFAARQELDIDPEARLISGHMRGAFVEAKLDHEGTELRIDVGEGALAMWIWTREGGLEVDGEDTPAGVERALRELPSGVNEVEVVARWIEAHCDRLDGAALGAALHRVLDARDALVGASDAYR